uniref:BmCPV-1 p101 n=1 Tax=Bombyx mori cytoplasmic polyhedrosis virus TaxID=110829 RepID=Q9DUI3_CPVBM|nr:BmCPV-1 p101 [Bombyx mori cypovirus 1]
MKQLFAFPLTYQSRKHERSIAQYAHDLIMCKNRLTPMHDLNSAIKLSNDYAQVLDQFDLNMYFRLAYAVPFLSQRVLRIASSQEHIKDLQYHLATIETCRVNIKEKDFKQILRESIRDIYFSNINVHNMKHPFEYGNSYTAAYKHALHILTEIMYSRTDTVFLPLKYFPFCNILMRGYSRETSLCMTPYALFELSETTYASDPLSRTAFDFQQDVFRSNYDLLKLCGDIESNPGPVTWSSLSVEAITLCPPIRIPSDDEVKSLVPTLFSSDEVCNIFKEYNIIDPSDSVQTMTLFNTLRSKGDTFSELSKQFHLTDVLNTANRFKVSEKLMMSIAFGMNIVVIDHENNQAYLTRTCDTDQTLFLLISKEIGSDSVSVPFVGDDETHVRYVSRVTITSEISHALFPGEALKPVDGSEFFDSPALDVFYEMSCDYGIDELVQLLVPNDYDIGMIRSEFNVPRTQWSRFDVLSRKNPVYPPRPQPYGMGPLNDEQAKEYAKASIRIFNTACPEHKIAIPVIYTDDEIVSCNKSSRYYYPTSHAGTSIINHKQCAADNKQLAPLFGSTPKKLFSKYVSQTNGVFLLMRIYIREIDNDVFDSGVIYVTLRVGNDGIGTHVILTTSYLERIGQSMLVNHVYKIKRMDSKYYFQFLEVEGLVSEDEKNRDMLQEICSENDDVIKTLYQQINKTEREISRQIGNVLKEHNSVNGRAIMKRADFRLVMHETDEVRSKQISVSVHRFKVLQIPVFTHLITVKSEIEYGIPLFVRDALVPRIKRRLTSTKQEQHLTSDEAYEINASYRTGCKAVMNLLVKGDLVRLPCGMITTVDNPILHKHSCTLDLHALTGSGIGPRKLRIHSAFKCSKCHKVYNNNILAQRCVRAHFSG